eukprot:CAMPEP_0181472546 /NCGR_PEP_ID=MMETSP1110-20121109/39660_1 /TAXON_ID=174948 /ORGANISM="Symbiodinium sp., Strain CCMP421" /LENGTH=198 /DNA_ID=CAMNT_0023597627 /DNA_START=387 /DNA_END=984 /DNA_ORIENTATION=+
MAGKQRITSFQFYQSFGKEGVDAIDCLMVGRQIAPRSDACRDCRPQEDRETVVDQFPDFRPVIDAHQVWVVCHVPLKALALAVDQQRKRSTAGDLKRIELKRIEAQGWIDLGVLAEHCVHPSIISSRFASLDARHILREVGVPSDLNLTVIVMQALPQGHRHDCEVTIAPDPLGFSSLMAGRGLTDKTSDNDWKPPVL